jgi:DDE superfamily endonuclease
MPYADTEAMNKHLTVIAACITPGAHGVVVLDGAGWHSSKALAVPPNLTLMTQPPFAPEVNPVENVWEYLRKNNLAIRITLYQSGKASLGDSGAGNTKGVSLFALALDGCMGAETDACYEDGDFGYQFAARYQKGGLGDAGNELGFLASVNKSFAITGETTLCLLGEAAWFRHLDGGADDAIAFTGSGALEAGAMTYFVAYSQQRALVSGGTDSTEHLLDLTAMFDIGEGVSLGDEKWAIGAGYSFDKADGTTVHTIGLKLSSEFGAVIPFGK